jgi:hypothetical protein
VVLFVIGVACSALQSIFQQQSDQIPSSPTLFDRKTVNVRLFFQQIKEKAVKNEQVIQTALANPLDKFELGIRKLIEDFMIERDGRERQDRDAVHGRSRFSSIGLFDSSARDFRCGKEEHYGGTMNPLCSACHAP